MAKLRDLTPDISNANRGTERGRYALEASLRKYGAGRSILIDREGRIIAGNKTAETAADVGIDDVIIVQTDGRQLVAVQRTDLDLDSKEARELAYADNRVAELDLSFDPVQLLADLQAGVDLAQFWRQDELDELLADLTPKTTGDTEPQVDRAEELRQKWGVEVGQLWQLGEHRLVCGDCTDAATVARVMGGERAALVFTDPPYNVAGESDNFAADASASMYALKNADWDKDFDPSASLAVILSVLADDASVYICTSHFLAPAIWAWMKTWAAHHSWCAWHKTNPMPSLSKRHWTWDGELIPYATRGKHTFNFPATGHAPSIWDIPKHKDTKHPTEKPVEVPSNAIQHSSNQGDIVFDPFLGSGTTLIACENLGRRCRAVEISPAYVAVALERWATHTGKTPVLLES